MAKIVMLLHGVGNPDHNQYGDIGPLLKKEACVFNEDEFREAFQWYTQTHDMGGGNCGWDHGLVLEIDDVNGRKVAKCLGRFSYNGRYHEYDPKSEEGHIPCFQPPRPAITKAVQDLSRKKPREFSEYKIDYEVEMEALMKQYE